MTLEHLHLPRFTYRGGCLALTKALALLSYHPTPSDKKQLNEL